MIPSTLADDYRIRPELFRWNGRVDARNVHAWLEANQWRGRCPDDLVAFWEETGGGDVFETETILGPLSDPALGDDIAAVNRAMRSRGMPHQFLIFHTGLTTSAVDLESSVYVELAAPDFRVVRRFTSLDEWYRKVLRSEYRERYGLP